MNGKKNIVFVYAVSILFILFNAIFLIQEYFYFLFIPIILIVILLALFSLDKLIYIVVFLTPLSISLKNISKGMDFDMQLPTEPILFGILLLFLFKLLTEQNFDRKIMKHPITITILINLGWILLTSITSTMPVVSFKFLLSRLWFIASFYFIATQLFIRLKNIRRFMWIYIISFILIIGYTLVRHYYYGLFNQKAANWVMTPFFNDHTSYGAMLVMFVPFIIGSLFSIFYSPSLKVFIFLLLLYFITATLFSYTRAAWISLVAIAGIGILLMLRISFRNLMILTVLLITGFFIFKSDIMMVMEENKQDSSKYLTEHIQSISNVATDASNVERINRWNSALRMFKEKPLFGWGPGTYMFKYAPFQISKEKTIISTNAGDRGNAHSEYIGPLAESGIGGCVTFVLILLFTTYYAMKICYTNQQKEIRLISLTTLLGLITYFIHGILNNFLDTDKASVPFWGFIAVIVALDVYHSGDSLPSNNKA